MIQTHQPSGAVSLEKTVRTGHCQPHVAKDMTDMTAADDRQARLALALRENLKRRKQQARSRAASGEERHASSEQARPAPATTNKDD